MTEERSFSKQSVVVNNKFISYKLMLYHKCVYPLTYFFMCVFWKEVLKEKGVSVCCFAQFLPLYPEHIGTQLKCPDGMKMSCVQCPIYRTTGKYI